MFQWDEFEHLHVVRKLKEILPAEYTSIDLVLKNHGLDKVDHYARGISAKNFVIGKEMPLQITKSLGVSCWSINHIASTKSPA